MAKVFPQLSHEIIFSLPWDLKVAGFAKPLSTTVKIPFVPTMDNILVFHERSLSFKRLTARRVDVVICKIKFNKLNNATDFYDLNII